MVSAQEPKSQLSNVLDRYSYLEVRVAFLIVLQFRFIVFSFQGNGALTLGSEDAQP